MRPLHDARVFGGNPVDVAGEMAVNRYLVQSRWQARLDAQACKSASAPTMERRITFLNRATIPVIQLNSIVFMVGPEIAVGVLERDGLVFWIGVPGE